MLIYFRCKEENLTILLESGVKPSVGDKVICNNTEYVVKKVVWCLEEVPKQSSIIVYIGR